MEREQGSFSRISALKDETKGKPLLRRADWRFLLNSPHPERSVCFASGDIAEAVTMVSKETVSPDDVIAESCDLAVVSNPTNETLRSAWSALRPGGNLYGEWYSPLLGGSAVNRKQLEEAGFEEINRYWPWPWPGRGNTQFWLPIEAPSPLDYFFRSRPPSRSLQEGLFRSILRIAWRIAHRARLLIPVCVTAVKKDRAPSRYMNQDVDLSQVIKQGWEDWGFGPSPASIHCLMFTGGIRNNNKVVKFVFSNSIPEPCLVVKHARVPETIPTLVKEARNLRNLERHSGGRMENIPRLLRLHHMQDSLSLVETVVAGNPIVALLKKDNYRTFAIKATQWLGQLVRPVKVTPRSEWWPRQVESILSAFERKYGHRLGSGLGTQIRDHLLELENLPSAFEHRDFSAWNILATRDGALSVLDWDDSEPDGLPGLDLIFFLTTLALLYDGAISTGELRPTYRRAQDPGSFTGAVQAECLKIYFESHQLDPGVSRPLRLLAWAYHSLAEQPRIRSQEDLMETERENPFIQLLFEDLRLSGSR